MQKEELLQAIRDLSARGELSRSELLAACAESAPLETRGDSEKHHHIKLGQILYYFGGGIVFIGIVVMLAGNWDIFNTVTKISLTLGSGIAAYWVGVLLGYDHRHESLAVPFHFIAALVLPTGMFVTFYCSGLDIAEPWSRNLIWLMLTGIYLISYAGFRKNLFLFFTLLFGSAWFLSFTTFLTATTSLYPAGNFYAYRFMVLGVSYQLLGYYFSRDERGNFTNTLYFWGLFYVLSAALYLGGWNPEQNIFWELSFPLLVFGAIILSLQLKNKIYLVLGSLYLMLYILKITREYFTSSLGWSFSLMLAGFGFIAIGYLWFYLNKKYFINS